MSAVPIVVAVVVGVLLGIVLKSVDLRGSRASPAPKTRRVDTAAGSEDEIRSLLANGRKIDAIKLYRELHGVGLKEAKESVERMEDMRS